ncbi:MAG: AAA family ATPase, partial [Erysipelotrichaceae bacterium]|nr:AAA family ATPase [Erysipelotrichaceae bacterium]
QMIKAMMELGGIASCKKLSSTFGGHPSSYVGDTINLGKRSKKYFNLPACMDGKQERLFAIPFLRREITEDGKKSYEYKIRPELFAALKEIDLSDVSPRYRDFESAEESASWENDEHPIQEQEEESVPYSKAEFLDEVYMQAERYDTLVALLENKKNLILQGAPGVGKTFAAKRLAYSILGEVNEDRIEFVQFHQNYSYEDFIMGYKPDEEGFKLTPGIFYRFCKKAENHPNEKYFFIIDEINRGNMSKIFGELLLLIEKDYRNTNVTLAYNGMPFHVPSNVYIIGMMNTADRSLAMIDYALRRRFSFFEMEPGFTSEGFKKYQNDLNNETFNLLIQKIIELNRAIEQDDSLGAGFRIGHSYFCGQTECSEDWMKCVVNYDIIPMLEEYWFDDKQSLTKWSNQLKGVFDD